MGRTQPDQHLHHMRASNVVVANDAHHVPFLFDGSNVCRF
jgi:hypothetical protein